MSLNIFAYTERHEFKTLVETTCKELGGFAPSFKNSIEDFESLLGLFIDIDLVIIDGPTALNEFQHLIKLVEGKGKSLKHVLVLTDHPMTNAKFAKFSNHDVQDLLTHLTKIIKPEGSVVSQYISIPVESFIHFKMVPFDLYIKLSEEKYVKRVLASEDIDENTIQTFQSKGIKELYFERQYNRDFSTMLLNNMINKVETDYSSEKAKSKATNEVFLTTKEIVQSIGLPLKVIQVCESMMDSITADVIRSKDKFSSYLSNMKDHVDLSFQFRFVELTSYIATQIVEKFNGGNPQASVKIIVFSAFFCDIAIKEAEYLELRTEESIKDLWPEEKTAVMEHALRASNIVSKYKNAPAEVSLIVKQHHGSLDGVGFPKVCHPDALLLAKCLMASQELAYALLKNPDKESADVVVSEVARKFAGTSIHAQLEYFQDSCQEHLKAS